METCEHMDTCNFFFGKMSEQPSTLKLFKARYCTRGKKNCARYVVGLKLGEDYVPNDLFPSQLEKAYAILIKNNRAPAHQDPIPEDSAVSPY